MNAQVVKGRRYYNPVPLVRRYMCECARSVRSIHTYPVGNSALSWSALAQQEQPCWVVHKPPAAWFFVGDFLVKLCLHYSF